jgi:hypothetical protein
MTKKGRYPTQPIRRIDLSLPIVKTASYEIYYAVPQAQSRQPSGVRPVTRQKPLIEINNNTKSNNQITTGRPQPRLKHITGSVFVNLFVDMPPVPTDSSSTVADTISNALINSGYSGETLRALPSIVKHNKRHGIKDDGERSQASSDDRLLFESIGSFEDPFISKTKDGMWHNVHHPQLSTIKVLHTRQKANGIFNINDFHSRPPNTTSFEYPSQESMMSSNDRLYEKVENLTRSYFPSIQQLRHSHPCPELINNRMHLHREEKRDYVPVLFRPRVGR